MAIEFSLINFRFLYFFFFNDTATTEIYTLSLHDALPICGWKRSALALGLAVTAAAWLINRAPVPAEDRKSTRLNSSHVKISYAVFCLKKKKRHILSHTIKKKKKKKKKKHKKIKTK